VGIVGMEQRWPAELAEDCGNNSGIETDRPGDFSDMHAGGAEPVSKPAPPAGDDGLLYSEGMELTGEEPDLPLSSPPLPTRSDVYNPHSCAWHGIRCHGCSVPERGRGTGVAYDLRQ
jgi:hypothetical protein